MMKCRLSSGQSLFAKVAIRQSTCLPVFRMKRLNSHMHIINIDITRRHAAKILLQNIFPP